MRAGKKATNRNDNTEKNEMKTHWKACQHNNS